MLRYLTFLFTGPLSQFVNVTFIHSSQAAFHPVHRAVRTCPLASHIKTQNSPR